MLKFILSMMIIMIINKNQAKYVMMMTVCLFNMSLQTTAASKMSFWLMGDQLSFWNMNLALWMTFILLFVNTKNSTMHKNMIVLALIMFSAIFFSWNFMLFYILFEMSMIVMLILMVTWSYQPDRVEAMMFLIIMALMFSLPFMSMMMNNIKTLNFWFLNTDMTVWEYISFMMIFMMKMPFYIMHFWLPKVHVESPVQGSMILAAVMLKLGCYGMIRMMPLMKKFYTINMMVLTIAMWSMIVLSVSCIIQSDIKTLIAYSSVVHMSMVLMVILINKKKSVMGSLIIMMSHGLCASALFYVSNLMYTKSKSRSIMMNKGTTTMFPMLSTMWFIICMSNAPMPPAISIIGELMSLKLIIQYTNMVLMVFMMCLTSSLYSIFMFYSMSNGKKSKLTKTTMFLNSKSNLVIMMHGMPIIILSTKAKMLMIL